MYYQGSWNASMRVTGYYNPSRALVATSGMEEVVKFWSAQPLPSPEAQGVEMEEELEKEDSINLTAVNKADLRRLLDSQVDSETISKGMSFEILWTSQL